jgi:galactokinase/mevalonate kinase-like predicted kinase
VRPLRIINSVAPIRVCDNGGWTDTWFAGHGKVFNIGVYPYIEVQIEVLRRDEQASRVVVYAENYGERFAVDPDVGWQHHPLIEAAIERMGVPEDLALRITIFSEVPGGASTGTSASVAVALIGALDLLTPGRMTPHEVAYAAHAVETDMLKRQSGIGPNNAHVQALRTCAEKARDAVYAGNFDALGRAMIENTDAQANLNSALVSADARRIIEIARAHGAIGWKVNGAGGEGGSITLLCV